MFSVSTKRRFAPKGEGGYTPVPGALSMSRFANDNRGNVAMTFGLMIFIMMGFMGTSVDLGRVMLARKQTQEAVDAAVLAGMRKYQDTSDISQAATAAQLVFDTTIATNGRGTYPTNPFLVAGETVVFAPANNNTKLTGTVAGAMKTPFIGIATKAFSTTLTYFPTLPIKATSSAELSSGQNSGTNLEVSVMIDITGSMGQSDNSGSTKIETVKTAAKSMVDILVWNDQANYTSKVAIVPFSETINLGSATAATRARGTVKSGTSTTAGSQNYTVSGTSYPISDKCVTERLGTDKYTDVAPSTSSVGRYYSTYGSSGGTGVCPTATPVKTLSSDKTALKTLIGTLTAGGNTAGQMGTAWAWYMLSPNFNSVFDTPNTAAPYTDLSEVNAKGKPKLRKIAVLMTDGDYNTQYKNGLVNASGTNGTSSTQADALCTAMKAKGIEVFTIGSQVSTASKTFLKKCATNEAHFYDATDGNKMQQAFIDIAYKLVPPYLSH